MTEPRGRGRRVPGWSDAAALAAGLALPLAFAPVSLAPLALLSPAVLFLVWLPVGRRRAAWLGWLYGLGCFGAGVSWILESFRFSQVPPALAVALTASFVAFLALYPAVLGYTAACLRRPGRDAVSLLVVFPCGWTLAEWLRGWLLTGFPWLMLGHSQLDMPPGGLVPILGSLGATALVVVGAGSVALVVSRRGRSGWPWLGAAAALWVVAGAAGGVAWTQAAGEPLRVVLLQGSVPQDRKWLPEMRAPTVRWYVDATRRHRDRDLVLWPETALPGFLHDFTGLVDTLAREATESGSALLLGVPVADPVARRYYNAVLLLGPDAPPAFYFKRHLVPFGEYLPMRFALGPITDALGIRVANFSPGPPSQPPLRIAGHVLGVYVCYEIAFPAEVRRDLPGAALLITVSNDAWFGESLGPHQHLQIARARALESGRFVLRATNTGITAIIGPRGEILARAPQFEPAELTGEVVPMRGATPYARLGDAPLVGVCLLGLAAAAWRRRARGPSRPRG